MSLGKNRKVGIATKHGKGELLKDLLSNICFDLETAHYDTDILGTFSGEIPRLLSQRDAAVKKAELAIELLGTTVGLGSEGSIGSDPLIPVVNSDIETLAWLDVEKDFHLVVSHRSFDIFARQKIVGKIFDISELIDFFDLPNHAVIVHIGRYDFMRKAIVDGNALERAIFEAAQLSPEVTIETDLRAHLCPSRRSVIRECGAKLISALSSFCPRCECPGWVVVGKEFGLPCEICGSEVSKAPRAEIFGCPRCDYRVVQPLNEVVASPSFCDLCNP